MPRERKLVLGKYDIGEWRYKQLKAFCRQYCEKKAKADALLGVHGSNRITEYHNSRGVLEGTVLPSARGTTSDPVAMAAEKREKLLQDVELIDRCAFAVGEGAWQRALILSCCYGSSYERIDAVLMPNCNRNDFFRARQAFFAALDVALMEREGIPYTGQNQ